MWVGQRSRYSGWQRPGRSGERIPVGARFSAPVQTGHEAHPTSCKMGSGSFPGVKYGRVVLLTTHPILVPCSWKSRDITLPALWATTGPVTGTLYLNIFCMWQSCRKLNVIQIYIYIYLCIIVITELQCTEERCETGEPSLCGTPELSIQLTAAVRHVRSQSTPPKSKV